jgi:hypothetical protein
MLERVPPISVYTYKHRRVACKTLAGVMDLTQQVAKFKSLEIEFSLKSLNRPSASRKSNESKYSLESAAAK